MTLNAHAVFVGRNPTAGYLDALTIDESVAETLRSARDDIRAALRSGMQVWEHKVQKSELLDARVRHLNVPALRPKFRMQGSFSYHTVNTPARIPPQQVDLDDGVFLPVSFLSQDKSLHPILASKGYFKVVEEILAPLCREKGWKLVKGKASCVRVELTNYSHIDLALYAISDHEFSTLLEKSANRSAAEALSDPASMIELSEDLYRALPANLLMLAHRDEGWKESDPRKLEDWFKAAIKEHGEQIRRICRYLKGWRDKTWTSCRLTSIALMAGVIKAYGATEMSDCENRDDRALLRVASLLPGILSGTIENPVVNGARFDEGWTSEERAEFVSLATELHNRLHYALKATQNPIAALESLANAFGERLPNEPHLIVAEGADGESDVKSPAVLRRGLLSDAAVGQPVRDAVRKHGDGRYG